MKYKALICDVDGTLIKSEDALPSEKVSTALEAAGQVLTTSIATSRSYASAQHIIEYLNILGPSVLDGGAQIINLKTKKIFAEHTITPQDFHKIYNIIDSFHLLLDIQETKGRFFRYTPDYTPKNITQVFSQAINITLADVVIKKLSQIPTITAYKISAYEKDTVWITACNPLSTKQHGILEVAKILNIKTDEIIGVGDGYNDFPLLMACGLKVAMGNAVPELKAIADYIAPSVEDDGVADVIEKFILK